MKLRKEFNDYLADLAVMTFKLHNLHWNVTGLQFMSVHELTEKLYDTTFEYFDEVAEIQKIFGTMPDCKITDYLANAKIKEIDAKDFSAKEVLEELKKDLVLLKDEATSLRNASDELGWFTSVALLEAHVENYNKQLWFIEASLK